MRLRSLLAVATMVVPAIAHAGDKERCAASFENAQRAQRRGALISARSEIETCLRECSEAAAADCATWLEEVNRTLPSLVIVVQREGVDVKDAVVMVDNAAVLHERAVELDPGTHRVDIEEQGRRVTRDVVLREGEKGRRLVIDLTPRPTPSTAGAQPSLLAPERRAPVMWPTWTFGAIGVAGVATFAGLGLYGNALYADLEECRPRCARGDVTTNKTVYAVADVALGVGVVALGAALVSYLVATSNADRSNLSTARSAR